MIRPLTPADRDAWFGLWHQYLAFYRAELPAEVSEQTFTRLTGASDDIEGLVATDADGTVVGFTNIVFHARTWGLEPTCYLEDLFVDRSRRGEDVARQLIEAVYARAQERNAESVYWMTQEFNAPARSLYDTVANLTSFRVYRHEFS